MINTSVNVSSSTNDHINSLYLVISLHENVFAIPCVYVREIVKSMDWILVPRMPEYIRGVINLRGKAIPLLDLRVRMGATSVLYEVDQMIQMLSAREQDHVNWLKELEASVRDKRPFSLQRDPTKCAFGKWYYNYTPKEKTLDDIKFKEVFKKFDAPHKRIHRIADLVCEHTDKGDYQTALNIIEKTKETDLSSMLMYFDIARKAYKESFSENFVILEKESRSLAISIDMAESVEKIFPEYVQQMPATGVNTDLTSKTAKRKDSDQIVFVLDVERLFIDSPII